MISVTDFDIIYLSYDEPKADEFFNHLKAISPRCPKRVHGVKGFDAAHKQAAKLATTDRFITVDGDNMVRATFFNEQIDTTPDLADVVYSYSALNTVNGLVYGNGGIKIWPRDLVLSVDTHENADGVDFWCTYRYWQVNQIVSDVYYAQTPYLAYRAGYREAVKLSLIKEQLMTNWQSTYAYMMQMHPPNLSRLMTWAGVGADSENGIWSIYGARRGLSHVWLEHLNPNLIRDYDWFIERWNTDSIVEFEHYDRVKSYIWLLNSELKLAGIDFPVLDPEVSAWFKTMVANGINVPREGLMIPGMKPPVIK